MKYYKYYCYEFHFSHQQESIALKISNDNKNLLLYKVIGVSLTQYMLINTWM
jgi:hypothetical protein